MDTIFQELVQFGDPYIITGYNITATLGNAIYIENTDVYFLIHNCYLVGSDYGIRLDQVASYTAFVESNVFQNNRYSGILNNYCDGSSISGNTFVNGGIYIRYSSHCLVYENTCSEDEGGKGIYVYQSSYISIFNNTCSNNTYGMDLYGSDYLDVHHNIVSDNLWYGIDHRYSTGSTLDSNVLVNNGFSLHDDTGNYQDWTVTDNTVNGRPFGYFYNLIDATFDQPNWGELFFANCIGLNISNQYFYNASIAIKLQVCENTTITDSIFDRGRYGIYAFDCEGSVFEDNEINDQTGIGIYLSISDNTILSRNTLNNNMDGIYIFGSTGSRISDNKISNSGDDGIYAIYGNNLDISNNNVTSSKNQGIELDQADYSILTDNNVSDSGLDGILIDDTINVILEGNTVQRSNWGIRLIAVSDYATLSNNILIDNVKQGMFIYLSKHATISFNEFTNDGLELYHMNLADYQTHSVDNNLVNDKELGFYKDQQSLTLSNPIYGQLIFINCSDVTVLNQDIGNTVYAISFYYSDNVNIENNRLYNNCYSAIYIRNTVNAIVTENECSSNQYGIEGFYSDYLHVENNICYDNEYGIYIHQTDSCTLRENTCNNGIKYGIVAYFASTTKMINNTCNYNEYGIRLSNVDNFIVSDNICYRNTIYGIQSTTVLESNFTKNLIQENENYGIVFDVASSDNVIYHNSFVDNYNESYSQAFDEGLNNIWYNVTIEEGNYWSDYSGSVNYLIDGSVNSIDPYPLSDTIIVTISEYYENISIFIVLIPILICAEALFKKKKKRQREC